MGIEVQNRNEAHKMVEDCMLVMNRSFATWLKTRVSKGLFNTQPGFRTERWSEVKALLKKTFNKEALKALNLTENLPDLAGFKLLMRHVDQANLDWPLKAVLLRCFERGQLKQEALPHMAMGLEVYSTLTSPIRKYSDLTIIAYWLYWLRVLVVNTPLRNPLRMKQNQRLHQVALN